MEQLKRKRAAQGGIITCIYHKLQRLQNEDPADLDVDQLEHQIETLKTADQAYLWAHMAIEEQFPDQVSTEEELETLEHHDQALYKAIALARYLISIQMVDSSFWTGSQSFSPNRRHTSQGLQNKIQKVSSDYEELQQKLTEFCPAEIREDSGDWLRGLLL